MGTQDGKTSAFHVISIQLCAASLISSPAVRHIPLPRVVQEAVIAMSNRQLSRVVFVGNIPYGERDANLWLRAPR
jgi:hypothetical protein